MILEKDEGGNTYLHLVMPATAVHFLNESETNSFFDFANTKQQRNTFQGNHSNVNESEFDDVFVELGCKVYEVNKVYYRGGESRGRTRVYNAAV